MAPFLSYSFLFLHPSQTFPEPFFSFLQSVAVVVVVVVFPLHAWLLAGAYKNANKKR